MRLKPVENLNQIEKLGKPSVIINEFLESGYTTVMVINENDYPSFQAMNQSFRQCVSNFFRDKVKVIQRRGKLYLTRL